MRYFVSFTVAGDPGDTVVNYDRPVIDGADVDELRRGIARGLDCEPDVIVLDNIVPLPIVAPAATAGV